MNTILSSLVAALAVISFTAAAFSADARPVVPAGPVYASSPDGKVENNVAKDAKTESMEDVMEAELRAEAAKETKAKSDAKSAKPKSDDAEPKTVVHPAAQ